ncbi:hypothetical protein VKT23_012135 [Stygiomarasmius scandens]|uniref:Uncharacterized protein n=1 Tax=Marasmiellus scandens TaxID=2682957 RepID=A0ABR1JC14_9AGAR
MSHKQHSYSRAHMSKDSEGYPSWLPQRPPPPAPASTIHGSVGAAFGPEEWLQPYPRQANLFYNNLGFGPEAPALTFCVAHL